MAALVLIASMFMTLNLSGDAKRVNAHLMHGYVNYQTMSLMHRHILSHVARGDKNIYMFIHSGGGEVVNGLRGINYMIRAQKLGYKFTCYTDYAASMAFTILQACDKRIAIKDAILMQHHCRPKGWMCETFDEVRLGFEAARMGVTRVWWYVQTSYDHYFTAEEALRLNIVDAVIERNQIKLTKPSKEAK